MEIKHSKPTINKEDAERVARVVESGNLTNSYEVRKFEQEVADYVGQKEAIAFNSGTSALSLALLALDNSGEEVIIPSYVCIALLNAVSFAKLKPRIVDISEDNYNISLDEIRRNLSQKTKAVVVPHMFGDPVKNIEEIVGFRVPVIEDCALSIGAELNRKRVGSFSDLSVFSFYTTKVLTTGHGGMILSSSEELSDKIRDFMKYDNRPEYIKSFNLRMTDFQAALGRNQLSRLDSFIKRRREIAEFYDENFRNNERIRVPSRAEGSIYFRYILEVEDVDGFIGKMKERGVKCARPVFKPLHRYFDLRKALFLNTELKYEHSVSIPIYPSLTDQEVEYVVEKVNESS